jgi:hypothetical protein
VKIRVFGQGGELRFPFEDSGPWKYFKNRIEELGHEIAEDGNCGSEAVIANFHSRSILHYMQKYEIPIHRRTLIIWEPSVVDSVRFRSSVLNQYGTVLAPSVIWAERVNGKPFFWPQDSKRDNELLELWEKRSSQLVMIQSNKFSARKGELYSLRRKTMSRFSRADAHLLGRDWNRGLIYDSLQWGKSMIGSKFNEVSLSSIWGVGFEYSNYLGSVDEKVAALEKYKVSLVIENSADYVSEKLFDSVNAGCVSLYVGPELSRFGIRSAPFWNIPPNRDEIIAAIRSLAKMSNETLFEVACYQKSQLSKVWKEWENTVVLANLADLSVEKF